MRNKLRFSPRSLSQAVVAKLLATIRLFLTACQPGVNTAAQELAYGSAAAFAPRPQDQVNSLYFREFISISRPSAIDIYATGAQSNAALTQKKTAG
ncbi:hypothetical protein [Dyella sp. C9]|uniref:hypothetical protein n=1 Tax=Dyella sp. C9 TaxID=2202154 RepID=UPI001300684A|nr:hypothetical protein [Dyella sp. C9]